MYSPASNALIDRGSGPLQVDVFGYDVSEISQIRRIQMIRDLGHDVHSFTMRRRNMNRDFVPDWSNTHLYDVPNEKMLYRAALVAAAAFKSGKHRARLQQSDVMIARNLDMLAIAVAARKLAAAQHVPIIYECLDINGVMCRDDFIGAAMRKAERSLLKSVDMLVVSSEGFIRSYFEPVQSYRGAWALWENKIVATPSLPDRPKQRTGRESDSPIRLGWVGTLRCTPSFDLLVDAARRLGSVLEIHCAGVVHEHALQRFHSRVAATPNIHYHGPYSYPEDLAEVYGRCDVNWAQDLWQSGNNSDWLLPNRIYEASWAGCPSIAVSTTETGGKVGASSLGWVIEKATSDHLVALLQSVSMDDLISSGNSLLTRPETDFVLAPDEIGDVLTAVGAKP